MGAQGKAAFDPGLDIRDGGRPQDKPVLPKQYVDYFRVRIDPLKSGETDSFIQFDFSDGTSGGLHIRRAVAEFVAEPDKHVRKPD